eukprot:jgi/Mesen1/4013/ME000211S03196
MLDDLDIEGAIHAHARVVAHLQQRAGGAAEGAGAAVAVVAGAQGAEGEEEEEKERREAIERIKNLPVEECRLVVQRFLIAATAKDCGLMLTFRPLPRGAEGGGGGGAGAGAAGAGAGVGATAGGEAEGEAAGESARRGVGEEGEEGKGEFVLACPSTQQLYEAKVSFVDLDMKSFKKMPKYFELDQKIVSHYTRAVLGVGQ